MLKKDIQNTRDTRLNMEKKKLTIKNIKMLRVTNVEYDVERHQEIHRNYIKY
jgi:hypothetical protein